MEARDLAIFEAQKSRGCAQSWPIGWAALIPEGSALSAMPAGWPWLIMF